MILKRATPPERPYFQLSANEVGMLRVATYEPPVTQMPTNRISRIVDVWVA